MQAEKKKIIAIILLLLAMFFSIVVIDAHRSAINLTSVQYDVGADIAQPLRLIHLTDLHGKVFGEDNDVLVQMVADQNPDLIVMTGDMINRDDGNLDIIEKLISDLSKVAPVYYGYGNHETAWEEKFGMELHNVLSSAGAIVLNNEYTDVEINGQALRIGGYMGYYRQPGMLTKDESQKKLELAFADDFENTDRYKILLNHIPTAWLDWDYINKYPVDIVFSGHYHGGMIRIPIIDRGVYAPYVGLFPPYTKGVFAGSTATCVLSAGLGSEHAIPRLNNPPQIVVVDLIPENQ